MNTVIRENDLSRDFAGYLGYGFDPFVDPSSYGYANSVKHVHAYSSSKRVSDHTIPYSLSKDSSNSSLHQSP